MNDLDVGIRPVLLSEDGKTLKLLDQRKLPTEEVWIDYTELEPVAKSIEDLVVRGAPAIGCAAAGGMAAISHGFPEEPSAFRAAADVALDRLSKTRPTAVNLFVALREIREALAAAPADTPAAALRTRLAEVAHAHIEADIQSCLAIGRHGADLLPKGGTILTHCNAGALATAGWGTALGVIREAHRRGRDIKVLADETRPVLQGARLTSWELQRDGVPVEVIADNMAGALMARGKIQAAVVGADRIAKNGDVANKIGTYTVAVLCKHHGIPLFVAAPWTTIDLETPDGAAIPIEERSPDEVRVHGGTLMTPATMPVRNPAFDVTPAALVAKIVTERGVHDPGEIAGLDRG